MATYTFACGCSFPIIGPPHREGALPLLDVGSEEFPFCPAVWELLARGHSKGLFQLETALGRTWVRRLKPTSAEHLSALGALLRPGCLNVRDEEGKSTTEHYCDRKSGLEETVCFHPALEPILASTYFLLVYQEQSMQIGQKIAGFDLRNIDRLRKAIGKKDQQELAQVRELFLQGAMDNQVVTEGEAKIIWSWIEKSGRYQFNKSHSVSYGLIGYDTAYIKTHFPTAFFTSWLYHAKEKQDPQREKFELVSEARIFDVPVLPPDLRTKEAHVSTDGVQVFFGMADIKGVGEATVRDLLSALNKAEKDLRKPVKEWSWDELLTAFAGEAPARAFDFLVQAGALRWLEQPGKGRQWMLHQFTTWTALTENEQRWVKENGPFESLSCGLHALAEYRPTKPTKPARAGKTTKARKGASEAQEKVLWPEDDLPPAEPQELVQAAPRPARGCANDNRRRTVLSLASLLDHPPRSLEDRPGEIAWMEESLLGVALSCSRVDACDIRDVNCTCKEFLAGRTGYLVLGVEVREVKERTTKTGRSVGSKMAHITISDSSCALADVVIFPDVWKEAREVIRQGETVLIHGARDRKKNSLVVKKAWPLVEG